LVSPEHVDKQKSEDKLAPSPAWVLNLRQVVALSASHGR
jgi:hypothetical protein